MIGRRLATRGLCAALGAALAAPLVLVAASVGRDSGGLWSHLVSTVLGGYVRNTLLLAVGVATLTLLLGISTAWAVTMCRFPGRGVLRWALLLPLAIPAYLGAYAYTDLLQYAGPVQDWLRATFDLSAGEYWFPEIRSLPGAIFLLSIALYPYVYMAARAAFMEQSMAALEAARTLGLGPWRTFWRVALPLARPALAAGLALVLMETFAEFGAVQYCGVDTFATGIVRTFTLPSEYALTAAAQLSALLLAFVALLVATEAWLRRSARFFHTTTKRQDLRPARLVGARAWGATLACSFPVLFGFALPVAALVRAHLLAADPRAREILFDMGRNTLLLASVSALLAVLLAWLFTSARRFDGGLVSRWVLALVGFGYAVPGAVLAIGVLILVIWLDHQLRDLLLFATGAQVGLLLSGSAFALLYGYQSRFLAVALNFLRSGFSRIEPSLDGAARTLGAGPLGTALRVHLPMLRGTLFAAMLLVFVDVVKELPATLILRPFGMETLAVRVYQLASDERLGEASAGALAIIAVGLLPVIVLSWLVDRSRSLETPRRGPLSLLNRRGHALTGAETE